jgi:DNA-binding PadR family transcriptional regulator
MSSDLHPFSMVILALVGEGGAGPHDLVRMMRQGSRQYWTAAESHFYAEPKRLAALGYLTAETRPGRTRARTVYRLTARGRRELRAWAREPTPFPRIQSEAVVRVLAGDILADDEALLASLSALRLELDEIEATIDLGLEISDSLPHRARYLRLVHALGRRVVAAHREWLDEVEAELGR